MVYVRPKQEKIIMNKTIKKVIDGLSKEDSEYVSDEIYKAQFF